MNIFKKLFGGFNKKETILMIKKPDIEKLINSNDIDSSIIELDEYISSIFYGANPMERLSEPQMNFLYIQELEREVNNGGFWQFYYNGAGDFAHEIVIALKAIGAYKTAMIVEKANDQFPDKIVPKDGDTRQEILSQIEDKASEIWDELDQKFFAYEDDLNYLNIDYIRKHKNEF